MVVTVFPGPLVIHHAFLGDLTQALMIGLAATWIALLFHESGHALAAVLVGVRIWGIRLGIGPTIWQGRIGGCRVSLAVFPFLGSVQLLDEDANAIGYRDIFAGRWRFEWGPEAWRAPDHLRGRRAEQFRRLGAVRPLLGCPRQAGAGDAFGRPHARRHGLAGRWLSQPAAVFPLRRDPPAGAYPRGQVPLTAFRGPIRRRGRSCPRRVLQTRHPLH